MIRARRGSVRQMPDRASCTSPSTNSGFLHLARCCKGLHCGRMQTESEWHQQNQITSKAFAGRRRSESEPKTSHRLLAPSPSSRPASQHPSPTGASSERTLTATALNETAPKVHRLELELFEVVRWRPRIQVKVRKSSPALRTFLRASTPLDEQSPIGLRAIGWRFPGSHGRIHFARFLTFRIRGGLKGALQ